MKHEVMEGRRGEYFRNMTRTMTDAAGNKYNLQIGEIAGFGESCSLLSVSHLSLFKLLLTVIKVQVSMKSS